MANHFKLDFGSVTVAAAGEERLGGGDLLRIYEISGTVDLYFYKAGGVLVGKAIGVNRPIAFDFFRDFKIDGNERSFMDIKLASTAGATVDYSLSEGIRTESNVFQILTTNRATATGPDKLTLADTDTGSLTVDGDIVLASDTSSAGIVWIGATAIDKGFPLLPGKSFPVNDLTGSLSYYSQGVNTLYQFKLT